MIDKDKDKIRQLVLQGCSPDIKSLLLNTSQIELVNLVKNNLINNSSELAKLKKISIQQASAQLNKLYLSGYLNRYIIPSPTGGNEYKYYFPISDVSPELKT